MRSVLLNNYEVYSILNSTKKTGRRKEDEKNKKAISSKEKQMDSFSILLKTQIRSMS